MAGKKEKKAAKETTVSKEATMNKLRKEHPFETDSQIENRYGSGREKPGSDGLGNDNRGDNH